MGVSSDGMLYFGFTVGEDEEQPEWLANTEDHDFDNFICDLAGLPEDAKYADRKVIIDACPVELHSYCSYDYPMYILSPKGCGYHVSRGHITEVSDLFVEPAKIEELKAWCNVNNIEYEEPKWLLCSMYG